ncbi:transposase [Streptomyces sp. OV198]|uniref:transposase n=1 Tax=Streptomyces sp. OV198 TaxID=1882787 RepID=UPI00359C2CF3
MIDGIRFRVRTGIPWRDMPEQYGPWGRAYDLFCRWQRNGAWSLTSHVAAVTADPQHR